MRTAVVGVLVLLLLMAAVMLMSTDVQAQVSTLAVQSVSTVQPTPTEDATVTALNKQKLMEDVEQQQHTLGNWLWSNAAAFFSSLALVIAGVFTLFRYLRDQRSEREKQRGEREKQREDHQAELARRAEEQQRWLKNQGAERERQDEEQQRWLKNQETELEKRAEERFQAAVIGLGDEREGAQIGAAILLRTFLRPGYEQFYTQTFDLAVANLRRRGASRVVRHQLWDDPPDPDMTLPLTTLNQALIVVFKEAFPLARDQEKREPASLGATGVQLDHAYLVKADLKQIWGPQASLQKADLRKADLSRAYLREADFSGADLSGANLHDAHLRRANLSGANLSRADLNGADLSVATLSEANLYRANLIGATLSGTILSGATLSGATLAEVILIEARLSEANLSEANLYRANLSGADLSGALLGGADLSGALLYRVDLSGANLSGALLSGADLSGANLSAAKGLTKEQRATYKAQGALVDKEPASNVSQESVSTSPPLEPGSVQPPSPQETPPILDASQSHGMPFQSAPDEGAPGKVEKGDDVGRTP